MLIIRHLSGPLAGTADRMDPKLDRIVFGRRTDCQVIYPPEATIVAREHFALVRKPPGPAGHWTIELFGEPFVAVNGIAADPGQRLAQDATFELGRHGGPSFTIHEEADAATDNLPLTVAQEEDKGARVIAAQAGSSAGFARRIAVTGLLVAVLAGAVAAYYYYSSQAQSRIAEQVRAHLLRAAFLVEAPVGNPEATAFPIGPHTLGTNSHVAELFKNLAAGAQMTVRQPGQNGKTYVVVAAKMHPGYAAFTQFLHQDVLRENAGQLGVAGYDVATLEVKEDLPQDAILELAGTDELRALKSATVIATAGYPLESISGGSAQAHGATPEFHSGTITGITNFFFLPADFAKSQLIHHDLPTTGGQSGSPIVGESGHVIALNSAANFYFAGPKQRIPSGAIINYAQRVDMLQHLLAGDADREIADDQQYWEKEFAVFTSGPDLIAAEVAKKFRDEDKQHNIDLVPVSRATATLTDKMRVGSSAAGYQRQAEIPVSQAKGAEYVYIVYAQDGSPVQLWLYNGTTRLAEGEGPVPFVRWIRYKPSEDANLSLWIINPKDQDLTYTLQVYRLEIKGPAGSS